MTSSQYVALHGDVFRISIFLRPLNGNNEFAQSVQYLLLLICMYLSLLHIRSLTLREPEDLAPRDPFALTALC